MSDSIILRTVHMYWRWRAAYLSWGLSQWVILSHWSLCFKFPSILRLCWLSDSKDVWSVKIFVHVPPPPPKKKLLLWRRRSRDAKHTLLLFWCLVSVVCVVLVSCVLCLWFVLFWWIVSVVYVAVADWSSSRCIVNCHLPLPTVSSVSLLYVISWVKSLECDWSKLHHICPVLGWPCRWGNSRNFPPVTTEFHSKDQSNEQALVGNNV